MESNESQIFIGNLERSESLEPVLYELLSQCGKVRAIRSPGKGYAFAEMESVAAATYAVLALNGMRLHGRAIRVASAMEDEVRQSLIFAQGRH